MNLFLLSKHFTQGVQARLSEVAGKDSSEIKMVFCAAAADFHEQQDVPDYVQLSLTELKTNGIEVDWLNMQSYLGKTDELIEFLKVYDAAFFSGGSYPLLVNIFHQLDFFEPYKKLLDAGLVHIGFSAGAMFCSEDMRFYEVFGETAINPIKTNKGLGIFPHYIFPHYGNKPKYTKIFESAIKKFPDSKAKFIPLTNDQAIYATENDWEII